jgi:membrane protease subunit (stomatin/prohibitin family)
MGLWDRITGQLAAQFLDVVQWVDSGGDTVVWRFPIVDQAFTRNSKLIVREGQACVFLAGGKLSEVFGPGTYTLDTPNTPLLVFFESILYALETPYKGDAFFVSTKQFTANGWGTPAPIPVRDADFGPVRVKAFGTYSFRVVDPARFLREIVGTDGLFTAEEITQQLRQRVVAQFVASLAEARVPLLDLALHYTTLGDRIRDAMDTAFQGAYGLALTDFTISSVSVPEEVEKAIDTRSRLGILGNLDAYTKLQAADAIAVAAANPGIGGTGIGLGVGIGLGQTVAAAMTGGLAPSSGPTPPPAPGGGPGPAPSPGGPPPPPVVFHYSGPSGQSERTADEIVQLVAAAPGSPHHVWQPGWAGWRTVREVPELSVRLGPPPPP